MRFLRPRARNTFILILSRHITNIEPLQCRVGLPNTKGTPQRKKLSPGVKTNFWRPPTHPPTNFTPQNFKNHENQKNDKIGKTQKRNFWKTKKLKICQKNVFGKILSQNNFLRAKFELSEPPETPKHQNSGCQQCGDVTTVQKAKIW